MKKLIITVLAIGFLSILVNSLSVSTVHAQATAAKDAACQGVALTGGNCSDPATGKTVNSIVALIINIFSLIVGVTAVIMIIVGGFKYITSTGDSASINSAKNTILYAIVGLIVVALAQVIVQFVLSKV